MVRTHKGFTKIMHQEDIQLLQAKLLELLDYIDILCKEHKIKYSLSSGTVLGAIRHNGFIPWDDDLDIMLERNEYTELIRLLRENAKEPFVLQEAKLDYPLYFSKLRMNGTAFVEKYKLRNKYKDMHQGIFLDIFPLDYASKNTFVFFLQSIFSRILVAQSLFQRGYNTATIKKKMLMLLSLVFLPFRKTFFNFVVSVKKDKAQGLCDFFGTGGGKKKPTSFRSFRKDTTKRFLWKKISHTA
jgi:lipopolysaccharide cholinephosphotransferase